MTEIRPPERPPADVESDSSADQVTDSSPFATWPVVLDGQLMPAGEAATP